MSQRIGIDVMKKFILLRGHEGSGKSTFALQKIAEFLQHYPQAEIVHIDNDMGLYDEQGVYRFDFEKFAQIHRENMQRQRAAFDRCEMPAHGLLVINANPNQKSKTCYAMLQHAQQKGFVTEVYRLHYFFDNVHAIGAEDVQRSYQRLNDNPVAGEIHLYPSI